jgi:hypothetical protein
MLKPGSSGPQRIVACLRDEALTVAKGNSRKKRQLIEG